MAFGETLFDLLYLTSVVALGIHLALQPDKSARQFGIMGIILGLGDSFHLVPRIISYWSEGGFEAHAAALSYGKAITSITMTVFYLLYYFFYKNQTGEQRRGRDITVYVLVAARVVLTLLPQNEWGTMPGNYTFGIIRNIPFAILGILLIIWSAQKRGTHGLKYMALLISLSFLFYAPVVAAVNRVPALGALMLPKTAAYFLIVLLGYKRFIPEFNSRQIAEMSFVYLIFGLAGGVFFREFTKFYNSSIPTPLSGIHGHLLILGFISMLVIFGLSLILREKNPQLTAKLKRPLSVWHIGLLVSVVMMLMRGIMEVLGAPARGIPEAAVSGLAGLGHIVLGAGTIWTTLRLAKSKI